MTKRELQDVEPHEVVQIAMQAQVASYVAAFLATLNMEVAAFNFSESDLPQYIVVPALPEKKRLEVVTVPPSELDPMPLSGLTPGGSCRTPPASEPRPLSYDGWYLSGMGNVLHFPNPNWPLTKGGPMDHALCGTKLLSEARTLDHIREGIQHRRCKSCEARKERGEYVTPGRYQTDKPCPEHDWGYGDCECPK